MLITKNDLCKQGVKGAQAGKLLREAMQSFKKWWASLDSNKYPSWMECYLMGFKHGKESRNADSEGIHQQAAD